MTVERWAVIVAGGAGTRFGAPKQFVELVGRPVLSWSVEVARAACHGVVVVLPTDQLNTAAAWNADAAVTGGPTRSASVRCGLEAVPMSAGVIVVHDAARPFAGRELWETTIQAVDDGADGAIPGVEVSDTIRQRQPDGLWRTLERGRLIAVQTPQAFRADVLRRAHLEGGDATDDAALVEAIGGRIVVVPGSPSNLKLTSPSDLVAARALAEWMSVR
jgi:2-C-methyl-D-erythritol 4-phosphate cytidylyltransferase